MVDKVLAELKMSVFEVSQLARNVQKSHPMSIPLGSEGLTKDIFSRLTKEDLHFFLNISHSFEYSTNPDLYRTIRENIENDFATTVPAECQRNIVNINLYATQTKDILRHSVLAHEAGHVLIRFDAAYKDCFQKIQGLHLTQVRSLIDDIAKKNPQANKLAIEKTITEIHTSWLEELFVDLVSVHALGPAAFFAMKELTLEEWPFGLSDTHPSVCKRIIMIWTALEKRGFQKHMESEVFTRAQEFVKWCEQFWTPVTQNPFHAGLDAIFSGKFIDQFIDEFSKANFLGAYTEQEYKAEVPDLAKYFKEGIAVTELPDIANKKFKIVSGSSLLNAAWMIEETKGLATNTLNPVLNKALANLYLKKSWDAVI